MKKKNIKPCLALNEEERKRLKETQLEIFDYFLKYCREHNLKYQLCGGTLLGAVRHKGYIPWDDDLDIYMPAEDYYRFIDEHKDDSGFRLDCREKDVRTWQSFAKLMKNGTVYEQYVKQRCDMAKGIFIDIIPVVSIPSPEHKIKYFLHKVLFYMLIVKCRPRRAILAPDSKSKHPILGRIAKLISRLTFFWCSQKKLPDCATK